MENTNKLTGKDLINVGIYSAMTLVIFFVVGLLTALPVVYPFLFLIWPIVCGIPMMLYYTKIRKFGMLTITGIIGGIFFYLIGYGWIGLLGWFLGGLLGDVVLKIGGYQKFKVTVLSYACFCLGIMGCPANLWFAGEAYWENIHTSMVFGLGAGQKHLGLLTERLCAGHSQPAGRSGRPLLRRAGRTDRFLRHRRPAPLHPGGLPHPYPLPRDPDHRWPAPHLAAKPEGLTIFVCILHPDVLYCVVPTKGIQYLRS